MKEEAERCITGSEFRNHQMIARPWLRPPINSRREESPIPAGVPGSAGQSLSPERSHMVHRSKNSYFDMFDIYELYYFLTRLKFKRISSEPLKLWN